MLSVIEVPPFRPSSKDVLVLGIRNIADEKVLAMANLVCSNIVPVSKSV